MFSQEVMEMLIKGIGETLYMTLGATIFGYVLGLPMGIIMVTTSKDGIRPNAGVYKVLDVIVNIGRSIPFLILLILLMPLTKAIVGKSYGSTATIVPLVISAAPFIARMVESSLNEVDSGVIEAAKSMGASTMQIITKVMLVEARTSLIVGVTITLGTVLGYSAMAGTIGGGGLGDTLWLLQIPGRYHDRDGCFTGGISSVVPDNRHEAVGSFGQEKVVCNYSGSLCKVL